MSAVTTADRGFTWSDDETSVLLKLWGANDAQSELLGNKRNFVVYEKISEKMNSMCFMRSASQCREKIKRMKREYTLTKQYNDRTTGPKKFMRFYEQFERILLEKQSRNQKNTTLRMKMYRGNNSASLDSDTKEPENLVVSEKNSWDSSSVKASPVKASGSTETEVSTSEKSVSPDKDVENPWTPAVVLVEGEQAQSSGKQESRGTVSPCSFSGEPSPRKKRKIASKMALFQSMMDSLTLKFMRYQEESDSRCLGRFEALEQERMTLDENVQKMWMEFEERRRRDEQDHELKVMSAFRDILGQITVNHKSKD